MRISDWSSDVCSSDLGKRTNHRLGCIGKLQHGRMAIHVCAQKGLHLMLGAKHGGAEGDEGAARFAHVLGALHAAALDQVATLADKVVDHVPDPRSEEHTSALQSLMRISSAVFCLKTNN